MEAVAIAQLAQTRLKNQFTELLKKQRPILFGDPGIGKFDIIPPNW